MMGLLAPWSTRGKEKMLQLDRSRIEVVPALAHACDVWLVDGLDVVWVVILSGLRCSEDAIWTGPFFL